MPKPTPTHIVKNKFAVYGFKVGKNFEHKNNKTKVWVIDERTNEKIKLSINDLTRRVRAGKIKTYVPNYDERLTPMLPINEQNNKQNNEQNIDPKIQKWAERTGIKEFDDKSIREAYNSYVDEMKSLMRLKSHNVRFSTENNIAELHGFIEAAKVALQSPKLTNYDIRLTLTDNNDGVHYKHLNVNTVRYFDELFNLNESERLHDSTDNYIDNITTNLKSMRVEFIAKTNGKRDNGGLFPFLNISGIDLTRYGIYSSELDERMNESCLVTAFKSSNLFSDDEIKLLRSLINTRKVRKIDLPIVCELLNVNINIKKVVWSGQTFTVGKETNKSRSYSYSDPKWTRTIDLLIMFGHYLLNETTNYSQKYIEEQQTIDNDPRFKNHERKTLLKQFSPNRYTFAKTGLPIDKLITVLHKNDLLKPIDPTVIAKIEYSFMPVDISFNCSRPLIIPDRKCFKPKHYSKYLFGYEPDESEVQTRLTELQNVINDLKLRHYINVRHYTKFSELMQKVMFEYGCFDNVQEICGKQAIQIRNECVFPKPKTADNKPFYSNEKLYYIDLNGAYMAAVKHIPLNDGSNESNHKVKELIEKLYAIRRQSNPKLSKTLKFMMNSCWGYSIRRPKVLKNKYVDDINDYIDKHGPYVFGYKYTCSTNKVCPGQTTPDSKSGFVQTVNTIVPHFTTPQFAKSVLDEFKSIMDKIKSIVCVYYENVDAILISESDYNKLNELGYIGPNLGQFKIEHIFNEIAIKSARNYMATLDNGQQFIHVSNKIKQTQTYNEFVTDVKNSLFVQRTKYEV